MTVERRLEILRVDGRYVVVDRAAVDASTGCRGEIVYEPVPTGAEGRRVCEDFIAEYDAA